MAKRQQMELKRLTRPQTQLRLTVSSSRLEPGSPSNGSNTTLCPTRRDGVRSVGTSVRATTGSARTQCQGRRQVCDQKANHQASYATKFGVRCIGTEVASTAPDGKDKTTGEGIRRWQATSIFLAPPRHY